MNRRGFMGALAASGLIPFLPKPEEEGWPRQNAMTDELVDDLVYRNVRLTHHKPVLLERTGSIKVDGGVWPSTVRVPRLEGARAVYHR